MDQQLALFQSPEPRPNKYRLFLGIFPDAEAIDLICEQRIAESDKWGLGGKPRPRSHLHITVHLLGDYPEVPQQVVADTSKVCARVLASETAFEVTFNHVMSFRSSTGIFPFVLINPNGNTALMKFHRVLVAELVKHRLARPGDLKFVPHVTMLYDRLSVSEQPVRPVRWTAKETVLVLSHLGATKYDRLESWTLGA